jgi:HNH endonuclease
LVKKKTPAEKPFKRAKPPADVARQVLHEAGYKCANPACYEWLSLDFHHITYVSQGGHNTSDNLLSLCKNCHGKHHAGIITHASIRAWKMLRLSINEALDRRTQEVLLALHELKLLFSFPVTECSNAPPSWLQRWLIAYDQLLAKHSRALPFTGSSLTKELGCSLRLGRRAIN